MKIYTAKILTLLLICALPVFARKVPAFQASSMNALSCLDALKVGVLTSNESLFLTQKMKCRELLSAVELTAKNERDLKVYSDLFAVFLQLEACRLSATAQPGSQNFAACLTDLDKKRDKAKQKIALKKGDSQSHACAI